MIVKYINCQVKPNLRSAFSEGQHRWRRTAQSAGFIAQTGGWQGNQARILALWDAKSAVDSFMRLAHDAIAEDANQQGSYSRLEVGYWQHVLDILGQQNASSSQITDSTVRAAKLMADAQFIRTAQCSVSAEMVDGFIEEQRNLWNPAMVTVTGMLGGLLLRSSTSDNQFLVITFWLSEASHQHYARHVSGGIKALAKVMPVAEEIQGGQINIVPQWRITAALLQ
ncbi:DUF4937 domain-containing protein [Shewanella sp. KX20019]|uniref:DUF4937 domain-containing protein n=1 Tax=Shewanella sp. KX20019 TaxID=2803864 RepID=UPI0019269276|nr:DUF4937 domain-containing protein [Shewanella sp. KX20019]QQX81023.1 DUF4937 domain-containing protein [Shewanella sp. KX20019]